MDIRIVTYNRAERHNGWYESTYNVTIRYLEGDKGGQTLHDQATGAQIQCRYRSTLHVDWRLLARLTNQPDERGPNPDVLVL